MSFFEELKRRNVFRVGAGHWLMESHAEVINEKLGDWFKDLPGSLYESQ